MKPTRIIPEAQRSCGLDVERTETGVNLTATRVHGDGLRRRTTRTVTVPFAAKEIEPIITAIALTPAQLETLEFYQGLNVPATWFIGMPGEDGSVEVIALGEGFVWSIRIGAGGDHSASEASVGEFSTGIDV